MLLQCLQIRPADIDARTLLMQNLIAQNRCPSRMPLHLCNEGTRENNPTA